MSRFPLGYYIIIGLLFWGIPAAFVAGPLAILYTLLACVPVWLISRRKVAVPDTPSVDRTLSTTTCTILIAFSLVYVVLDASFGRQLFRMNMFLYRGEALDRIIEQLNDTMSEGGGLAALLGQILSLLPFALIDVTRSASRYFRGFLWATALIMLFYETTTGRGPILMAAMAILIGRAPSKRRIIVSGALATAVFVLASFFRGDTAHGATSLLSGVAFPFINLGLMLKAQCGSAPWYSFAAEFFKKFLPAFLVPKTVFSFNMQMSLCLYPNVDNKIADAVSIFTWLGEVFYYKPSWVTAILAGTILGGLARIVDRRLILKKLNSSHIFAGLLCIDFCRSRSQDVFTLLIAQIIFLFLVWPTLTGITRAAYRLLAALRRTELHIAARKGLA